MDKIPKTVHYCWFGKGKKSKMVNKCMESWKKYLLDYKIIEWNEDNFDINSNLYVRQAYEAKKYAFVTDYVRLYALYNYGGIYLDTDVEVLKSLDEFLDSYENGIFLKNNNEFNEIPNIVRFTEICCNHGLKLNNKEQEINGFKIFPKTVFSPLNARDIDNALSENTCTIHYFAGSWLTKKEYKKREKIKDKKV